MAFTHDVCIRGGGIVGRTLALLLARERLRVALVERPAPATPDVRAYALNRAAKDLLSELRVWPDTLEPPAVTPVQRMEVWGDDRGHLSFDAQALGVDGLNWMVDVPALETQLGQALALAPEVTRLAEPVPAPLTVVCEGRGSASRSAWGVAYDTQPYPQHALAARLDCAVPHGGVARQWFAWGQVPGLSQAQGEVLALLPLGGAQGRTVALVWSVHPQRAQALLALGDADFAQTLAQACHHALGELRLSSARAVWPLQISRARLWVGAVPGTTGQSFALAGDAAHALHPLAGQGLNLGLADVATLAQVLRDKEYWRGLHDLKLLRRYARARQAQVKAMGWVTDGLQWLFGQPGPLWAPLRNWGLSGFDRSGPIKRWMSAHAMGTGAPLFSESPR